MIEMADPVRPTVLTPYLVGDRIKLKKKHACGGLDWEVYRIGADLGLLCQTCGRRIMLSRREVARRIRRRVKTPGGE